MQLFASSHGSCDAAENSGELGAYIMKRQSGGPILSAVFVDYDNIYMSLKRKSEEAAKRFAKDASLWLRQVENGQLITATNMPFDDTRRRIVMNRCYGNPVPRRNQHDNSTDMNSFPFVRHHFLRAGFEVIDCPPLTAQLKNSSDIRMVMDVRDYLTHDTYFDEFIILSGDADFTPVLHRLRAHARRTVIFANDFTAAPYTAISDGEVREADLITLILNGTLGQDAGEPVPLGSSAHIEEVRRAILGEVAASVRASPTPVPLEALADRASRALGHDKTIATGWAGAGSFRELLIKGLPEGIRLTGEPPYLAYDVQRHASGQPAQAIEARHAASQVGGSEPPPLRAPAPSKDMMPGTPVSLMPGAAAAQRAAPPPPQRAPEPTSRALTTPPAQAQTPSTATSTAIQQSIARIQDACQAPPLAPPEYRLLFEVIAKEINDNDLIGAQTLSNITQRAQERGLDVRKDDVRFILEVVSEPDPWFEQGASANLFAGRFRNFVVARCRSQGLKLSADELDLIDAWFAGGSLPPAPAGKSTAPAPAPMQAPPPPAAAAPPAAPPAAATSATASRWWSGDESRAQGGDPHAASPEASMTEEFPRIVRTRLRS